ncbi:PREDICTED: dipeptidase 1-like [Wasmannia auropunctata]|uniref:dipeptidase 1-like n=1 Tax=Wasmannia auropunctata TaxID=64793 RepID=UPI0005EFF41B|nr:PREDICTED: dipeptidase 1-like [Wasmannia auropunctata]
MKLIRMPVGLEDVSKYPDLFDRLYESRAGEPRWTKEDLEKLAGKNLIRVFQTVEAMRDVLWAESPHEDTITGRELYIAQRKEGLNPGSCQSAIEWDDVNATDIEVEKSVSFSAIKSRPVYQKLEVNGC